IPAVLGSGFYGVAQTLGRAEDMVLGWGPTLLATVISFVLGLFVIHWFLGYVKTRSFGIFVWYRVALGIVLYALLGAGVRAAVCPAPAPPAHASSPALPVGAGFDLADRPGWFSAGRPRRRSRTAQGPRQSRTSPRARVWHRSSR